MRPKNYTIKQNKCMISGSERLEQFLDLGAQPNGNNFPDEKTKNKEITYPMSMSVCLDSWLVQINDYPPPEYSRRTRTLSGQQRVRVLRLYLGAVTCLMAFMVAEALGMYTWGIDINVLISEIIPYGPESIVSMDEDVFSIQSLGTLYRLTGLTGDPNVTGVILALALPLAFYCHTLRPQVSYVFFVLGLLLMIVTTVSNTAVAIAGLLLLVLSARYWKHRKLLVASVAVPLVIGVLFVIKKEAEKLHELVSFKLDIEGDQVS